MWNVSGLLLKRYSLFTEKLCMQCEKHVHPPCLFIPFLSLFEVCRLSYPSPCISFVYSNKGASVHQAEKKNKRSNLAVAIYPRFSKYKALHAGICMHVFLRYNLSYMISILEYRNNHHHDTVISFFNNNSKPKNIHVIALCKP